MNSLELTNKYIMMLSFSRKYLFLLLIILIAGCKKESSKKILDLVDQEDFSTLLLTPSEMINKRGMQDTDGWTIKPNINEGVFVVSPVLNQLGAGSARALVSLKIPDNSSLIEKVATIRIINTKTNQLLSIKQLFKNDFSHSNTFQLFDLFFETNEATTIEIKIIWHGSTNLTFNSLRIDIFRNKTGMPELINQAGVSNFIAEKLAQKALNGLGFNPSAPDGPNKKDIVFVGKYYIAWIDQTGFYGKMNGLWLLNGLSGDDLNFLHKDNERPINYLGVAENGDGKWMANYVGAEHYELPHLVFEAGKSELLYIGREYTDWYSVNEAGVITGANLDWWTAAMKYRMGFSIFNKPLERIQTSNQLYVQYESPMTKESDGDLIKDGDRAHAHMLFANKIRYPFYLRTGYTLYGDRPYFERHYQYKNEQNNPPFTTLEVGNWSLIGGLVITDYRSPYKFKVDLNQFVRLNEFPINGLPSKEWVNVAPHRNAPPDALWHHQQSYTMSNNSSFEAGNSIHVSAQSTGSRIDDMGGCTCFVHGGLEIGGGVMGGRILPLAPGQLSKTDTRIFLFPQGNDYLVDSFINTP